jgi:fibronectin type 3 domain-containing protein
MITENSKDSNCSLPAPTESFSLTVTQNNNNLTLNDDENNSFTGTLNGNIITWSGSYEQNAPDDTPGRTTLNTMRATIDNGNGCNSLTGSASWTWNATDGSNYSCSGATQFSGGRSPAGDCEVAEIPATPRGLNAFTTSSGSIRLNWADNADNENNFTVERSEVSSSSGFSQFATLSADSQYYDDTGLAPLTTYYYRTAAYNNNGQSNYSTVTSATTQEAPLQPPAAPSGLGGHALSSTTVSLTWTDNSDNESEFKIYRANSLSEPFSLYATAAPNVVSSNIKGLEPATDYVFKVVSVNPAGSSTESNVIEITTPVAPNTAPTPASDLSVGSVSSSTLTLTWTDTSSNEEGFRIYAATTENGAYSEIATTTDLVYVNRGLKASTTYWYKVSAYNNAGESAQTTAVSGTLPPLAAINTASTK